MPFRHVIQGAQEGESLAREACAGAMSVIVESTPRSWAKPQGNRIGKRCNQSFWRFLPLTLGVGIGGKRWAIGCGLKLSCGGTLPSSGEFVEMITSPWQPHFQSILNLSPKSELGSLESLQKRALFPLASCRQARQKEHTGG